MVGDYVVADSTPIAEGPDWQDVLVDHPHLQRRQVAPAALRRPAQGLGERAAARSRSSPSSEYRLTYGIKHEGIAVPSEFKKTDDGPALVFEYDDAELPLDAYLAGPGADLAFDERIALVMRLGETLRYAHQRHLIHRALSPQRVWVRRRPRRQRAAAAVDPRLVLRPEGRSTDAATRWSAISAGLDDLLGVANPRGLDLLRPRGPHLRPTGLPASRSTSSALARSPT